MKTSPLSPYHNRVIVIYLVALIGCMVFAQSIHQLDFIAAWQNPDEKRTVGIFQFFSDSVSYFSFGIPVLITAWLEYQPDTNKRENRMSFLYIVLAIAIAGLISYLVKKSFTEPRPYEVDSRIIQLSVGGGYSLPSGHTTEAFASTMAVTLLTRTWKISIAMFCWASLVAISRIYLGVHYPFDIFVGMFIGSSVAFLFYRYVFLNYFVSRSEVK